MVWSDICFGIWLKVLIPSNINMSNETDHARRLDAICVDLFDLVNYWERLKYKVDQKFLKHWFENNWELFICGFPCSDEGNRLLHLKKKLHQKKLTGKISLFGEVSVLVEEAICCLIYSPKGHLHEHTFSVGKKKARQVVFSERSGGLQSYQEFGAAEDVLNELQQTHFVFWYWDAEYFFGFSGIGERLM